MGQLAKGDKAPDFELKDQSDNTVTLSGLAGKKVLIYFYPKANTPGCTTQSCDVRDHLESLRSKGVEVTYYSVDGQPEVRQEMVQRSGRTSVPQIFIDDKSIGGFDDIAELDADDELDPLLGLGQ